MSDLAKEPKSEADVDGETDDAPEDGDTAAAGAPALAPSGAALAAQATSAKKLDPRTVSAIEEAIAQLSPEEARAFQEMVARALKKRRILLTGYLLSMLAMIFGTAFALYTFGTRDPGEFVAWAWFVPFASVAVIFFAFGRWAKRL